MSGRGQRICQLAEQAANEDDAESALRVLRELRQELDEFVREQVARALRSGRSFGDVARALEISRQAAHRRYRDLAPESPPAPPRRLVPTDATRAVLRVAHEHAAALGQPLASQHLLLGVLATDSQAAQALQADGVTLETARALARAGEASPADGDGGSAALRRMLRAAGRVALARGDAQLAPEEVLLAALGDADDGARRTLAAVGVSPAMVRQRLGC
jgi:ATP-dependent Clp protease ATP-binding subunit ClpA